MDNIFIYEVYIDDEMETGVDKVSLVKKPAIMIDFIYMSEQDGAYHQIHLEEEKRILTGPALIPDLEIVRNDEEMGPYFIKYSATQIEQIIQKFFKEKDQFSVNKDHKADLSGIYIYESWITGENDKAKSLGFDVPVGTWMISMKVDNDEVWEGVKSGKYRGFSIEGLFRFKKAGSKLTFEEDLETVEQKKWIKRNVDSSNVHTIIFQDETGELVIKFNSGAIYTYSNIDINDFMSVVQGLAECKTEGSNKWGEWYVGKSPSIGAAVWEYLINTGKPYRKGGTTLNKIEVKQVKPESGEDENTFIGRCMSELNDEYPDEKQRAAICYSYWTDQSSNEKIKEAMVSMILKDGNTLYTDGEMFDVGVEVYFLTGEEKVAVDAGEYEAEDGSVIVIGEGSIIAEIRPVEAPPAEEETAAETTLTLEAIKEYLDPIFNKLTELLSNMGEMKQSVAEVETKMEKILVEQEMKTVKPVDEKKGEASAHRKLDYDIIRKYNKKF